MNQVLFNREMLLNRDNEGIIAELLKQQDCYNSIWGPEYIMMNGRPFIDNAEVIMEIMIKCRSAAG